MRWVPWLLGIAGVVQHAIIAYVFADTLPADNAYVSADMSYLVMWLSIIGALGLCYLSCYDCGDGSCGCCGDDCGCGDCSSCMPNGKGHDGHGHEGHGHEGHSH